MSRESETTYYFDGRGQPCPETFFSFTDFKALRKTQALIGQEVDGFNKGNSVGFVTHYALSNYFGGVLEVIQPAVNGHVPTREISVPRWYESEEVLIRVAAINPDDEEGQVLQRFVLRLATDFRLHYRPQPNRYDGPFNPAFIFRPSSSWAV